VGTIFVENNGYLAGVVSRKDLLRAAIGGTDIHKAPVGIIMTRMPNIVFVEKKDSPYIAARRIIDHEVDSLPVVERVMVNGKEQCKVLGKVSKTNITKFFLRMITENLE
jgi:CBS domain-containing protein